jgi:hypothetical protein
MDTGSSWDGTRAGARAADEPSLKGKGTEGRWTEDEHAAFILGLNHYGRQWMVSTARGGAGERALSQPPRNDLTPACGLRVRD